MDPKAFAKLSKQLGKDKKKNPKATNPAAPKKQEDERPLKNAEAGAVAGGSEAVEFKRKNAGKGVKLPERKKPKGEAGQKDIPVVVIVDPPTNQPSVLTPLEDSVEGDWPLETVHFPIKKGTAVMQGTLDPREFLRGATPSVDRSILSRLEDESLELKALQASVTASLAFGELVRRAEQHRLERAKSEEVTRKLVANNTEAIRQLARLEEALRQSEEKLRVAKEEARAEGKADAEKAAAEAANLASEKAEAAKKEAVAKAEKDALDAFKAGSWKSEEHQPWVASVVEASADTWAKGPGAMWLALKGKSFYEGAQYFTQALIYRKLARHHGVDPKEFQPEAYGLPPLLPDVRIPLPEGEERELLEDSELARCDSDGEEAEDDASSKTKEDPV
ncbi:unnamed protein product, partial [Cuscuta epithymum]